MNGEASNATTAMTAMAARHPARLGRLQALRKERSRLISSPRQAAAEPDEQEPATTARTETAFASKATG